MIDAPEWLPIFRRTVKRLTVETRQLRYDWVAILATRGKHSSNLFIQTATGALHSDALIRLARILEDSPEVKSFWFLHRCSPCVIEEEIDIPRLQNFSIRLKKITDRVFAHIDGHTLFDPQKGYAEARISISEDHDEIANAIKCIWKVLCRLYREQEGREPCRDADVSLEGLRQDFERDLGKFSE